MLNKVCETLYSVYVPNKDCNLKCEYCATDESEFLKKLPKYGYEKWSIHNEILEKSRKIYDSEILKIVGGGEVFLDQNLEKWIQKEANYYAAIFILTNGVALTEKKIESISDIINLNLGLSLDGHLYEMNSYRFPNKEIFKRVLEAFQLIGIYKIPLQINMVMHNRNFARFFDFLDFLLNTGYLITLHMSPVMPKTHGIQTEQGEQEWIHNLEKLLTLYDKYQNILLPKAYYSHLIKYYMNNSKRTCQCHIPSYMIQLFSSGDMTACPIVWNQNIGNVQVYKDNLFDENIYRLLFREGKKNYFCRKCIVSYDILSLYIQENISEKEIRSIPLFSSQKVYERIKTIKAKIKGE